MLLIIYWNSVMENHSAFVGHFVLTGTTQPANLNVFGCRHS
ncbi:hypothetical protein [Pseudomonas sp. GZD-222]